MPPFELATSSDHLAAITDSHARCRAFGLNEHLVPELHPHSAPGVRLVRERHQRLFEHAVPVMEMLFDQIVATHSIVVLSDTEGQILNTAGDTQFLERMQQIALSPGINWSEAAKGTNAVGTALFTERPTLVHGPEHYLAANRFLTCSAAPIFDHAGQVMGVLDVSGHQSSYHPHTLAMVTLAARGIEAQWFRDHFHDCLRLHFHPHPRKLGTVYDATLALAADGSVLGANRAALELLGLSMAGLRKLGLHSVFGTTVGALADHGRRRAATPLTLQVGHGNLAGETVQARTAFTWTDFWPGVSLATGVALPASELSDPTMPDTDLPAHTGAPRVPSVAPTTLQAQEQVAIRSAVAAAGGNISRAARQLGIARNTLYRKLRAAAPPGDTG